MNGPTAHGKTCETRTNEKAILEQKQNMTKLRIANKTDVAQMDQPNKAKLANTQNSQNCKARPGAKKQRTKHNCKQNRNGKHERTEHGTNKSNPGAKK